LQARNAAACLTNAYAFNKIFTEVIMKKYILFVLLIIVITAVISAVGCGPADPDDELFADSVRYSDFGAIGDGITDDFAAIKKTHDYANANGVAVVADKRKKYYIGETKETITVKTNVDWSGAEFIIDDKSLPTENESWRYSLFTVSSDCEAQKIDVPAGYKLKAGQKETGLTFDKSVMLAIFNENKRDFLRYGSYLTDQNSGYPRQEIILVDKNGTVDDTTPIQWDYEEVTKIVAYSVADEPVLLRGGTFTTIANDDPQTLHYFERGIKVERSNTTVKNVEHYVTKEGATGSPYNGFFRANNTANVVFENCVMTGRKLYKNPSGNDQGTYDTRLGSCNNVKYLNCTQSNDHTDPNFWGIMCSDFCKNLFMEGCKLSRFDAHMGVYNATITDSDIGQNISVTGGGLLKIENVIRRCAKKTYFNRFVTLRQDYGSFFYGDIVIKDSVLLTGRGINYVIAGSWLDWNFGYECRFPTTVTLDNVSYVYDDDMEEYLHPHIFIFSHMTEREGETPAFAAASSNPPVLTERVIIKNNVKNTEFKLTANTMGWFADTEVIYA